MAVGRDDCSTLSVAFWTHGSQRCRWCAIKKLLTHSSRDVSLGRHTECYSHDQVMTTPQQLAYRHPAMNDFAIMSSLYGNRNLIMPCCGILQRDSVVTKQREAGHQAFLLQSWIEKHIHTVERVWLCGQRMSHIDGSKNWRRIQATETCQKQYRITFQDLRSAQLLQSYIWTLLRRTDSIVFQCGFNSWLQ